jgi:hypothetical protein
MRKDSSMTQLFRLAAASPAHGLRMILGPLRAGRVSSKPHADSARGTDMRAPQHTGHARRSAAEAQLDRVEL